MPQGGVAWSVVLNVQIGNTAKHSPPSRRFEAVLDSGVSQCLFHSDLGKAVGLKVESDKKVVTGSLGICPYSRDVKTKAWRSTAFRVPASSPW